MKEQALYARWTAHSLEDTDLVKELAEIAGNANEIYERFYTDLEFGTAGLRGILGAGINRMNIYTVRRATQGLAAYLAESFKNPSAAIAYDSRIKSDLFAREAAAVLAANGVKVYLYKELMPTPALSYAVRQLGCQTGIVITASHNPAKYNGYKAYDETGCQLGLEAADRVLAHIKNIDIFDGVTYKSFDACLAEGSIEYISDQLVDAYIARVLQEQLNPGICKGSGLKLVYTPLNGAGKRCVLDALHKIGMDDITVVPEQANPDGNFPTCPYPNPEILQALEKGLALCEATGADLLIATDPDADRVGAAVLQNGKPRLISGNEMGVLMLDYIAKSRTQNGTMPKNPITTRTIVTTNMVDAVAAQYGIEVKNLLTGFKYIGELIKGLEDKGEENRYIFGFEESYGYLTGSYVRDKDAINGAMIICEMAAYYKRQSKTLADALDDLYAKHGAYSNTVDSFGFEGADGMKKMASIMDTLRQNPPKAIGDYAVDYVADYKLSTCKTAAGAQTAIVLPKSNVLEYGLAGLGTVIVRPSGTEPKIKVYYCLKAANAAQAASINKTLQGQVNAILGV